MTKNNKAVKKDSSQPVAQDKKSFEKSIIKDLEDSRLRIKPWFLQLVGGIFIILGIIFILYPLISDRVDVNLPDFLERQETSQDDKEEEGEEEENDKTEETPAKEDTTEDTGNIASDSTKREDTASTISSREKSARNIQLIESTGVWRATGYSANDITIGAYEVRLGDTLWEIAEAAYGDGSQWQTILAKNTTQIGFLPDGSQALIVPGQFLTIP